MNQARKHRFGILSLAAGLGLVANGAWAGPVICNTSANLTNCAAVETIPALVEKRLHNNTSAFASGVDLGHQVTDLLGIALAGIDGNQLMGLGFPDQTIAWDGTALENTYQVLLEQQAKPLPLRSLDVGNGFSGSLAAGGPAPRPVVNTSSTGGLAIW